MPKVAVKCSNCQAEYQVEETNLGKKGRCKKCQQLFVAQSVSAKDSQIKSEPVPNPAVTAAVPKQETRQFKTEDQVPAVWQIGDEILDLYVVKGILGEGGMGTVYRVHHKGWNKDLAVKSVKKDLLTQKGAVENFEKEAETWVNLNLHPHTVSCWYVRRLGGIPRIFAEYVEGGTLQEWIHGPNGQPGKLYDDGPQPSLERILDIAIQFAWGLHSAHEQGLIHQDVKPANVMMTPDGIAKVTDFGLSKVRGLAGVEVVGKGQSILVSSGGMTPAYCSPEQAEAGYLSRKTDIWSWAVSVLEIFTGDVTWLNGAAAREALESYLEMGAGDDRITKMPTSLVDLLRLCLDNDPNDRPRDMQVVVESLKAVYQQSVLQDYSREEPKPEEALADTLNNRAVSLFDLGKKKEAEEKWQDALKADSQHPEATYNLGLVEWRSGLMTDQELLQSLREVRASAQDKAQVEYLLGLVHLERADLQASIQLLSAAVETGIGRSELASTLIEAQTQGDASAPISSTFEGHTDVVTSVAWSPDGEFVISGSKDKTLRLWRVSTRECLRVFKGHAKPVTSAAWSLGGSYVLSGSDDETVRVWKVSNGKCIRTLDEHMDGVTSVSWSPDGRYALSGSRDKSLRLWKVSTGECLRIFTGH